MRQQDCTRRNYNHGDYYHRYQTNNYAATHSQHIRNNIIIISSSGNRYSNDHDGDGAVRGKRRVDCLSRDESIEAVRVWRNGPAVQEPHWKDHERWPRGPNAGLRTLQLLLA